MRMNKKQLMALLLSFTMTFSFAGCSSNKPGEDKNDGAILINDGFYYLDDEGSRDIDDHYYLRSNDRIENKLSRADNVGFEYLIDLDYTSDMTNLSRSLLAKIVDEHTLSNSLSTIFEKNETRMTSVPSFLSYVILPEDYKVYGSIGGLRNVSNFDYKCQKLLTYSPEGTDIVYNVSQRIEINSMIDHYNHHLPSVGSKFEKGNTLQVDMLFKVEDGKIIILASKQTGIGSECKNVQKNNIGNYDEAIKSIKNTKLSTLSNDNAYNSSYIYEVLDAYSGTDIYMSSENDGKDFSAFKK